MTSTTEFLDSVKRTITVPTYQPRLTTDDILAFATEEQRSVIVPEVISCLASFFLVKEVVSIAASQKSVQIPTRAAGRKLKETWWEDDQTRKQRMQSYDLSQSLDFDYEDEEGLPEGYVIEGDKLVFHKPPKISGRLTFFYYLKPSKIVQTTRTGNVLSIGTNSLTLDKVPANIVIGSKCDVTQFIAGFELIYRDLTVSNIAGTTVTFSDFATENIAGVSVNDSLSLAGETSILQLPEEATDALVQKTCIRILEALNFPEQEESATKKYIEKITTMKRLLTPRVENQPLTLGGSHPLLWNPFRKVSKLRVSST